jgi:O-antigen/teichoic acid export membrane protein
MSRLSKNIVYNVFGQGLSLVVSFVAVRFVFRRLGGDALGLIYFNQSVSVALMLALELGIYKTTVREVASHHASNPRYIRQFIGTATSFYWAAYLLLAAASSLVVPVLIHRWVHLEGLNAANATKVMHILMLSTLLTLPRGLYDSLLLGLEQMRATNLLRVGINATQQFGVFFVLLLHGTLLSVACWIATCAVGGLATYFLVCARLFSWRTLLPSFDASVVRSNWAFSAHAFTISLSGWFLSETDKFVISHLLPLGVMGSYTVAKGAISRCSMLTVAVNEATYPHLSALFNAHDLGRFRAQYQKLQDLVCLAILPIYAAMPFISPPVFAFMLSPQMARMLLLPVTILAVGSYLYGAVTIPNVAALAAGKPDIVAKLNSFAALVVVVGYVVFIRFFGLAGASLGWALYPLLAYAYSIPRTCRECLGVPIGQWFARLLKVFALGGGIYALAWFVAYERSGLAAGGLLAAYLLATLAFLLAAYLTMTEELRGSLRRLPWMPGLGSAEAG